MAAEEAGELLETDVSVEAVGELDGGVEAV